MYFFIEKLQSFLYKRFMEAEAIKKLPSAPNPEQDFVFSLFDYKNLHVKKLIRYLKNKSDIQLQKTIAEIFYQELLGFIGEQQDLGYFKNPLVIAVPISKWRHRERKFNQVHVLAKHFAKKYNFEYSKNIIKKTKKTQKQALIKKRKNRFLNIKNAFSLPQKNIKHVQNRDIIIVDDLITTGATLEEIKKLLEKSGARTVIAVTIAH